ncbi:hypothetical protein [Spirosoma panaciterrae]|uniref:hypothetical protein n=1 Tax=Spirosoma panaciterrae TaxID=496058 RepID=UPI000361A647|nr:hypothetical protein [Spirosoma panaciterrae]
MIINKCLRKVKQLAKIELLFTLAVAISLLGCKKKPEEIIDPDFASTVAGTYPIVSYAIYYTETYNDTLKFPYNGMTGTFDVKKIDLTHIQTGYTLHVPGGGLQGPYDAQYDTGECELRNDTGIKNKFSVYVNNKKTGVITPTTLTITVPTQGAGATVIAKK